jgi:hypothetical protein
MEGWERDFPMGIGDVRTGRDLSVHRLCPYHVSLISGDLVQEKELWVDPDVPWGAVAEQEVTQEIPHYGGRPASGKT